jgi:hypothetical protein
VLSVSHSDELLAPEYARRVQLLMVPHVLFSADHDGGWAKELELQPAACLPVQPTSPAAGQPRESKPGSSSHTRRRFQGL